MPSGEPHFELSYGQLLWAINHGRDPGQVLKDQARYLRRMDIPPTAGREAAGSGKRITYDFNDLVELGLALVALDYGFRPQEISAGLVGNRQLMRKLYAQAWREIPDETLHDDWVKSRGRVMAMSEEDYFVRLHNRRSEKFGTIDFSGPQETKDGILPFQPIERFSTGAPVRLIPLKQHLIPWVAWAMEAPVIKPGPPARG